MKTEYARQFISTEKRDFWKEREKEQADRTKASCYCGMSQATKSKQTKDLDEYDCGGNGPRWPVPGEESRIQMTVDDSSQHAKMMADATKANDQLHRIAKWQHDLSHLLADQDGVSLFFEYVKRDAGTDSIHCRRLEFYFACNGLKSSDDKDESRIRQIISVIYR